jgi:hypothetical protein
VRYALLDRTYGREPRRFKTKEAAGEALLNIAVKHWVVRRDPQRQKLEVEEGRPLLPFALAVVPRGGTLVTVARCYATTRPYAMKQLLIEAVGFDWRGTDAEHLHVVELTAAERRV